jgi:CrcB protein
MNSLVNLSLIAACGAMGALARFGLDIGCQKMMGSSFPLGTLVVNSLGCFLIGLLIASGEPESNVRLRLAAGVGFLGSFTTFSTFALQTVERAQQNQWNLAALNVATNLGIGIVAVMAGLMLGKRLFGG